MAKQDRSGSLTEQQGELLLRLARKTIAERLGIGPGDHELEIDLEAARSDSALMAKRGVFVTLHKAGQLRGCIGSLAGSAPIAEGVVDNALNAAFNDYRFQPVTAAELNELDVEVSILSEPQPLNYATPEDLLARLRPGLDGVIIRRGRAAATFLPQVWKQLPDSETFLVSLCRKAGLPDDEWRKGGLEVKTYQVQYFAEKERSAD